MTATFLQSELASLIQDSKKKYPDVRAAAEKSLADLKALPVTSESQTAGDLVRRPEFIDPFVLACKSKAPKLASTGVIGLQRLTASRAISPERLQDVLDAFREVAGSGVDVQLKILQTLPSLLQFHAQELTGQRLAAVLEICGLLQGSKTSLISSTAAATFQQLVTTVFENFEHDSRPREGVFASSDDEDGDDDESRSDASLVFRDLCGLIGQEQPTFLRVKALSPSFLLEVLGNIIINHEAAFSDHEDLLEVCHTTLMPALTSILGANAPFDVTVRVLRIVYILILRYADAMAEECEAAIFGMLKCVEPEDSPVWKRALCMEVFRAVCQEPALIPRLFELLDRQDGRKNAVAALMAAFARIASEEPSLVGLGRQSTIPSNPGGSSGNTDQLLVDPSGVGGAIGSVTSADSNVTGISMEWSVVRIPLMEQLDKTDTSEIPTTYIYSLVINCVVAIAEGLSKFVMPLSVPSKQQRARHTTETDHNGDMDVGGDVKRPKPAGSGPQKYQHLINPLTLNEHPRLESVKVCADLISRCWPAFLATCSTFFNSALDSRYYHNLVRAFQKMTQVSGILELATPRDAFLTCLAKGAIPISTRVPTRAVNNVAQTNELQIEDGSAQTPKSPRQRHSLDLGKPSPTIRNLLCMRALLNLGVALGPTLNEESWFIILETMQHVEILLSLVPSIGTKNDSQGQEPGVESEEARTSFGAESLAVRTASRRMFESTRGYSDSALRVVIQALFKIVGFSMPITEADSLSTHKSLSSPATPRREGSMHQPSRSTLGMFKTHQYHEQGLYFVLEQIGLLARFNIHRFASESSVGITWDFIMTFLLDVVKRRNIPSALNLDACQLINSIAAGTVKILHSSGQGESGDDALYSRCLSALLLQIESQEAASSSSDLDSDTEVHCKVLEALESILGHCGDSLGDNWRVVFQILESTFNHALSSEKIHPVFSTQEQDFRARSPQVLQTAFRSVQLIVSDFLSGLSLQSIFRFANVLILYGVQKGNVNISLTTVSLVWNLASLASEKAPKIQWSHEFSSSLEEKGLGEHSRGEAAAFLWFEVIFHFSRLCCDDREDVRSGTNRVIFKALEASGTKLAGTAWNKILQLVVVQNIHFYHTKCEVSGANTAKWEASLSQTLEGSCEMIINHTEVISKSPDFAETWKALLDALSLCLDLCSLDVSTVVFSTISRLLAALGEVEVAGHDYAEPAMQLWFSYHPTGTEVEADLVQDGPATKAKGPNQATFVQHTKLFIEAYRLMKVSNKGAFSAENIDVQQIMTLTRKTIFECLHPPYSSDLKKMAPEQEDVTTVLSILRGLMSQNLSELVTLLLDFIQAALLGSFEARTAASSSRSVQIPTFVAFSTNCVELLDGLISDLSDEGNALEQLVPSQSLNALAAVINSEYSKIPQNTDKPLWQVASNAANNLVAKIVTYINQPSAVDPSLITGFFNSTISIATAILTAPALSDPDQLTTIPDSKVLTDESFDITSFRALHNTIIPTLGHASIPQTIQKSYILILFHTSLVAKPWFFDFPDLETNPMKDFSKVRRGTVTYPSFLPRQKIPYAALDALFELVALPSPRLARREERLTLAKAATPYVLLRVAHAFKTFLADQRLRGLTPLPGPLQLEILTLLEKCIESRVDDRAFWGLTNNRGQTDNEQGDGKSHLRALYPLLLQVKDAWGRTMRMSGGGAWQESKTGRETEEKMREWSRAVSEDWGLLEG